MTAKAISKNFHLKRENMPVQALLIILKTEQGSTLLGLE